MSELTLTQDQQNAYSAFRKFLIDPDDKTFVLSGYAGTGKSTLVRKLLADLPRMEQTYRLLDPKYELPEVILTATTNKAAQNLAEIVGRQVRTIHATLGLTVFNDYERGTTKLGVRAGAPAIGDALIFIDEASYIDDYLLKIIYRQTQTCKLVFIGDPAQLLAVNATRSPVFDAGHTEATLTQIVRQADDNPIQNVCNDFREAVLSGNFKYLSPDNQTIKHLPREDFEREIVGEFTRPDWKYGDSKVLAWTNRTVIAFNQGIRDCVQGTPELEVGDYAVVNQYVKLGNKSFKTDQQVLITSKVPTSIFGIDGHIVGLDDGEKGFLPLDWDAAVTLEKSVRKEMDKARKELQEISIMMDALDKAAPDYVSMVKELVSRRASLENTYAYHSDKLPKIASWLDLRAAYACTVNKSQGSTYDKVFIDLDDMGKCKQHDQLARMLYVGASRARNQIVFTGDI